MNGGSGPVPQREGCWENIGEIEHALLWGWTPQTDSKGMGCYLQRAGEASGAEGLGAELPGLRWDTTEDAKVLVYSKIAPAHSHAHTWP